MMHSAAPVLARSLMRPKVGDLKVVWFPQIPCTPFEVPVKTPSEGAFLMTVLARYDEFQFDNRIKPDYSNAGTLCVYAEDSDGEGNPGWEDWHDEDTGDDLEDSPNVERRIW